MLKFSFAFLEKDKTFTRITVFMNLSTDRKNFLFPQCKINLVLKGLQVPDNIVFHTPKKRID